MDHSNFQIKKALPQDADTLSQLTFRSKAHWGYSAQQIEDWKEFMTITEDYIQNNHAYCLWHSTNIVAYYAFYIHEEKYIKLDNLFIDPNYIGKGHGKDLMNDFLSRVRDTGYTKVVLDSDPHAERFYERLGFKVIGQLKTSMKNRFLPIMELNLNNA